MGWIVALIGLCIVYYFITSIKDVFESMMYGGSFLGKLALAFVIATIASWILHFVIASSLMLGLSKIFFLITVVLIVVQLIISIFKK